MVTVGPVHVWRDPGLLLVAVLAMDDRSPALRFARVAHSRLPKIRVHRGGRADMGWISRLALAALANREDSSNFRVSDKPPAIHSMSALPGTQRLKVHAGEDRSFRSCIAVTGDAGVTRPHLAIMHRDPIPVLVAWSIDASEERPKRAQHSSPFTGTCEKNCLTRCVASRDQQVLFVRRPVEPISLSGVEVS